MNEGLNGAKYVVAGLVALLIGFVLYFIVNQADPLTPNIVMLGEILAIVLFLIGATLFAIGVVTTIDKSQKL